jgi:chitosanase
MDDLQKKTAQGIINIFETGRLAGNYGAVVVAPGDRGHLTYGRSQTTLASGGLFILIKDYCNTTGAQFADALRPFLDRLQAMDLSLDNDMNLRSLLARAGGDPVMQQVQDQFFDKNYWATASRVALTSLQGAPLTSVLGITTVYDSVIHGSFPLIRNMTNAAFTAIPDEKAWVAKYVQLRRGWLANNADLGLRKCVYRMDALGSLITANKWQLELPLTVLGIQITDQSFGPAAPAAVSAEPPVRASAHDPNEVALSLRTPFQTGSSVEFLQHGLAKAGLMPVEAVDGVFGPLTSMLVKNFQQQKNLTPDGIVGPATWSAINEVMQP